VLLFLPPRLLYLLSHFLLSHYPPYIPSHYFSQKPPLTYLPTYVPACLQRCSSDLKTQNQ
jgi:hypothetical protein